MDFFSTANCYIQILFGLLLCLFGFRLLRKLIAFYGFLIGFVLCILLLSTLTSMETWLRIVLSVVAGLLLGSVAYALFKVGVFLVGAVFGANVTALVLGLLGATDPVLHSVVSIVLAIAGGIIAVKFNRLFIIVSTSFSGASAIAKYSGLLLYSGQSGFLADLEHDVTQIVHQLQTQVLPFYTQNITFLAAVTVVCTIGGILIQYFLTAPKDKKKK